MAFVRERSCGTYLQKRKDGEDINVNNNSNANR